VISNGIEDIVAEVVAHPMRRTGDKQSYDAALNTAATCRLGGGMVRPPKCMSG